jgi:SWI/SNF-related matrix-associated actin-dependent regulator 1 of chromatin subfamily A
VIKLFPYQTIGAEFLASRKVACLFDEMGVGKSAQAITACDLVGAKKVLVICRAVARINWQREFDKFSKGKPELTITSYEGLRKILDQTTLVFDVAIVDEAHYAKEPGAARTQSVLGKTGAVRRAKRTWLLTGSPTPNHAGELWTALYTFGRTRLSYDQFLERYCTSRVTSYGRQITGSAVEPDRIAELRGMLEPIALRRTKEDVNLELPPIFYSDLVVKPGPVELISCYSFQKYVTPVDRTKDLEKILEDQLGVINGIVKGKFTDAAMKALEANAKSIMTLRRYQSMQKVEPVFELIAQELEDKAYEKLVVFAIHRDTIVNLQQNSAKSMARRLYLAVLSLKLSRREWINSRTRK